MPSRLLLLLDRHFWQILSPTGSWYRSHDVYRQRNTWLIMPTQIWRCYVLWYSNWCLIILIPLLLASTGEWIGCMTDALVGWTLPKVCNLYSGAIKSGSTSSLLFVGISQFVSAATTICATAMIAVKINLVTRRFHACRSYSKIIEILVQSAALQSFALTVNAIAEVASYALLESNSDNGRLALEIASYAGACRTAIVVCVRISCSNELHLTDCHTGNCAYPHCFPSGRREASHRARHNKSERASVVALQMTGASYRDAHWSATYMDLYKTLWPATKGWCCDQHSLWGLMWRMSRRHRRESNDQERSATGVESVKFT